MTRRTGGRWPPTPSSHVVAAATATFISSTAAVTAPRPAGAQQQQQQQQPAPAGGGSSAVTTAASIDVGVARVRYADTVSVSSATLGSSVQVDARRAALLAQGTFARTGADAWVVQGAVGGSLYTPPAFGGRLTGELAASAGGSAHRDHTRTGQSLAVARAHATAAGSSRGVWLGAGGGTTWDGATWHGVVLGEAGAWADVAGGASFVVTAIPTEVDVAGTDVRYTDATVGAHWSDVAGRAQVEASLGARAGGDSAVRSGGGTGPARWGSVGATVWLAGPLALTASGGSYPVDYTQGYPGGRFVTAGIRIAARSPRRGGGGGGGSAATAAESASPPLVTMPPATGDASAPRLTVEPAPLPSATRTVVVRVASIAATAVEVAGDFTSWAPVALARAGDGRWSAAVALPAGVHQVVVRVDGGRWLVPAGLPSIDDEFGGVAGLLVVPPAGGK